MRENLLDEQDNNINNNNINNNNINNNNINNVDEKVPLKNKIIHSITNNIEKNLCEGDDSSEDEEENEEKDEEREYPIRIELEGEQDSLILVKTKIQTHWVQNYKETQNSSKYYVYTFFYIALPFITSLNLIGIFQIISVMNALSKVLSNSFWSYIGFVDKEDELYNFYSFYFKESINEGIEFDLIETMSFLGMIFYEFYGYKVSSILFMIPNILSFFLIYLIFSQYNDASEQYNILQILYLFASWVLLFIGVGSSALLSQQRLIDNYGDYISFLKQVNFEDYQNNNFIFICVTSILGSLIKYIFDIIISRKKFRFDQKYNIIDFYDINNYVTSNNNTSNEINNIIYSHDKLLFFVSIICIYGGTIVLSIILYFFFQCFVYKEETESEIEIIGTEKAKGKFSRMTGGIKDRNFKDEEMSKDDIKKICKFFGYIFYLDKIENKQDKDRDNQEFEDDTIKDDNNKKEEIDVQIDDETQKSEVNNLQKLPTISNSENNSKKCKRFRKTFKLIGGCFCKIFSNLKLISNSLKNCVSAIICNFICNFCNKKVENICPFCFCCECCYFYCGRCKEKKESFFCCDCCSKVNDCCINFTKPVKKEEYKSKDIYYFFCYKSERNLNWFDNFINDETQFKFFPLLVEFFLIQLITIVFDIKAEETFEEGYIEFINSTNIAIFILVLFGILFLFFVFTYLFGLFRIYLNKKSKNEEFSFECWEVSNIILNGTIGIVIVNSIYSFFASIYCLSNDLENNFIFIPILMNKCYYFAFSNHCTVYTDSEEIIDYFSSATLLSIYLFVWELFIEHLIKKIPITILLYIQIVLSLIIFATFIFSVFIMFNSKNDSYWFNFILDKFIKTKDENENKIKKIKDIKTIICRGAIDLYDSPPLIGLKKVGFNNYANSILQCLSQTEPLTNYFLKKTIEELNRNQIQGANHKDFPISNGYYELIQNLWSTKEISSSFSPKSFMKKIEKNNTIELDQPGAYKEFIIFILNKIHNELKKPIKLEENIIKQLKDKNNSFIHYVNDFSKGSSIISECFSGHILTTNTCSYCPKLWYLKSQKINSLSRFNYLIFPLEEIYNYNKRDVSLDDCFEYKRKVNNIYCENCGYPSQKTSQIYISPNILVLILDRGKQDLSNVKLIFKETIDITRFVLQKEKDEDKLSYDLYAVLTHLDQSHFVALCKSPVNKNWYKFDDENIAQINDFEKGVINFGNPDILFYQKIKKKK